MVTRRHLLATAGASLAGVLSGCGPRSGPVPVPLDGHGVAGFTLSRGTAQLALEKVGRSGRSGPVAVLGCGAVGLATARLLQGRGFDVTIYARSPGQSIHSRRHMCSQTR